MKLTIRHRTMATIVDTIRNSDVCLETGGALFGADDSDIVEHATTPGPAAIHRAGFFSRDLGHTTAEASRLYRLDGSQWVGEWHTHPSMRLVPSDLDVSTYARHLRDPELKLSRFLALICSAPEPIRMAAWCVEITGGHIRVSPLEATLEADSSERTSESLG